MLPPSPRSRPLFRESRIAVVVPAFDEAAKIAATIAGIPPWVDSIVVVDDASTDGTGEAAARAGGARTRVIRQPSNLGVGRAITTGCRAALAAGADVVVVVGADGQMDPADMPDLVRPVVEGAAEYCKGNRLTRRSDRAAMPFVRRTGTVVLSALTRLATGWGHIGDSQCGYTAASRRALESIDLDRVWARYGYPNDLLIRMSRRGLVVRDVPVRAIYGPGTSKMRIRHVILPLLRILAGGIAGRVALACRRAFARHTASQSGPPARHRAAPRASRGAPGESSDAGCPLFTRQDPAASPRPCGDAWQGPLPHDEAGLARPPRLPHPGPARTPPRPLAGDPTPGPCPEAASGRAGR